MTTSATIAIIGAGNIGARHLQSLVKLDAQTQVHVVDLNEVSLQRAGELFAKVKLKDSPTPVFLTEIEALPEAIDVCIVATLANVRKKVIDQLMAVSDVRYVILEKVAFQSLEEFSAVDALLRDKGSKAWVNCPRRMWPVYRDLKESLAGSSHIEMSFTRVPFALACNAIHLIDLFQYLTGEADVKIDGTELSDPFVDIKRSDFIEFIGTLAIATPKGHVARLTGYVGEEAIPPILTLESERIRWIMDQQNNVVLYSSAGTKWTWEQKPVTIPFQSALTFSVVNDLLNDGTCKLASFAESRMAHEGMLNAFFDRIEAAQGTRPNHCEIT